MSTKLDLAQLLNGQIAYYEARAVDWDTYAGFGSPYPNQAEHNRCWFRALKLMGQALAAFKPTGHVIEIAAGTGFWSEKIAETAGALTVLDSSPSMLKRNKRRCARFCRLRGVPYRAICSNVFEWMPDAQFDVIFFAFWLGHVPEPLFDTYWGLIARCLKPGGRVMFFDTRSRTASRSQDSSIVPRQLRDGREFLVVKTRHSPRVLERRLRTLGFEARVRVCGKLGLIGTATLRK